MKDFDVIKGMIYNELEDISHNGKLTKETVCVIGELVDILKDIGSIEMFEENIYVEDNGAYHTYDERGSSYSNRMPRMRYNDGGYRYGGGQSRNGSYRGGYGGYSREDGKEHMINKLEQLMDEATESKDKDAIRRLIDQMGH